MNALVPIQTSNAEVYRASTDAAGLCREIVLQTAQKIGGRKYVRVEGWQAIAIAHGCVASSDDVERIEYEGTAGFRAMGVIRRMSDGVEIARAEGFVGDDEPTWAKRPVYARRAMAQTRAVSRACRSAFAHVVVLIDGNLSTTPAEEMPFDGADERDDAPRNVTPPKAADTTDLGAEMDNCKSQEALLAWEQFRLKEIGRLSKAEGDRLADKFRKLLATLPEKAPAADLSADDVPEFS